MFSKLITLESGVQRIECFDGLKFENGECVPITAWTKEICIKESGYYLDVTTNQCTNEINIYHQVNQDGSVKCVEEAALFEQKCIAKSDERCLRV